MLTHSNAESSGNAYIDLVTTQSEASYVKDGTIHRRVVASSVMVNDASELDLLNFFPPCSIAYTAGFEKIWQKSTTGEWVEVI